MHHVYDGKEFKYVKNVGTSVIVSHEILNIYRPEVRTDMIDYLGVNEHMILSYLYANLETFDDIPLAYPLTATRNVSDESVLIRDVKWNIVTTTNRDTLLATPLVHRVFIGLPTKMKILNGYMSKEYQYLLDLNIPQVTNMIYRLQDLNEVTEEFEEDEEVDLMDLIESVIRLS